MRRLLLIAPFLLAWSAGDRREPAAWILMVIGPLIIAAAVLGPLHYLLFIDILLVGFAKGWHVAGIRFDATDLVFIAIIACFPFGSRR